MKKKKRKSKKINKKILIFLAIIIILLIIYFSFFNKKETIEENKPKYATVTINQDNTSNNSEFLNNISNGEGKTYKKSSYTYSTFLETEIEDDNLYVTINKAAKDIILFEDMDATTDTKYKVSGISKTIKNIFVGHFNVVTDFPVLFILYEDNTAQYVDIEQGFNTGNFKIAGTIDIDNINQFSNVEVTTIDNSNYIGVIATDTNGNSYEVTPSMIGR